jgi:hypothetical protein
MSREPCYHCEEKNRVVYIGKYPPPPEERNKKIKIKRGKRKRGKRKKKRNM